VYGHVFSINRNKPHGLEVVVDAWPDFKTIICRPDLKNKRSAEYHKTVTVFSTDEDNLRTMLSGGVIDWNEAFLIGGIDACHHAMLKEISAFRLVSMRIYSLVHLMTLQDPGQLPDLTVNRHVVVSSLNESHVDLVNNTWKFGGNENGFRIVRKLITDFPSCCITDDKGNPISWVLVYDYCALGLLYTLPEHRGKGYAKILISSISKSLRAQGYPVYCYIEEENKVSYRLFKGLGFTEKPTYRAVWFDVNY
ncbi:GLYL3 protein, partial [Amia calva]|nr:GLYL3 protein [Amia calva]